MEDIRNTLKRMQGNRSFQQQLQQMKNEVMSNAKVRNFIQDNQEDITSSMLDKSMMKLYELTTQSINCADCPSLEACKNIMQGYEPEPVIEGQVIQLNYRPCLRKVKQDEINQAQKLIRSLYVPKSILRANFKDYDLDTKSRMLAYQSAKEFARKYIEGEQVRGLYLHGKFGIGKSYILGAIANYLSEQNVGSFLVYVPELFREMKQSLGDNTLNEKLETIKNAPILMLDDIGAETTSSWTRDEILGSILQFRMQEELPTFFSSNYNYDELENHLTYAQRGAEEKLKAARIMERIKFLSEPMFIDGNNRREK